MSPRFFDLAVLERYRLDPRYSFHFRHFDGQVSISSSFYEATDFPEKDKVLIQHLGLAMTKEGRRKIVAFLRYLHPLSAEHQRFWQSYETSEECFIVPEYYDPAIKGTWPTHMSIYDAILKEMEIINKMCSVLGLPPLFCDTFEGNVPDGFGIILQLTSKHFDDFVHLLDKMLFENINGEFFVGEVRLMDMLTVDDGTVERRRVGSIRVLENWFKMRWSGIEEGAVDKIIAPFKEVRRRRQKPAHKIQENQYDVAYEDKQRKLVEDVYVSLRYIRLLLSNHPDLSSFGIPN